MQSQGVIWKMPQMLLELDRIVLIAATSVLMWIKQSKWTLREIGIFLSGWSCTHQWEDLSFISSQQERVVATKTAPISWDVLSWWEKNKKS